MKTNITVIPQPNNELKLVIGKQEAVATLRPDGALRYLTFASAEVATMIMEELDRSFEIPFIDEVLLLEYSQGGNDNFDHYLDLARKKYFL